MFDSEVYRTLCRLRSPEVFRQHDSQTEYLCIKSVYRKDMYAILPPHKLESWCEFELTCIWVQSDTEWTNLYCRRKITSSLHRLPTKCDVADAGMTKSRKKSSAKISKPKNDASKPTIHALDSFATQVCSCFTLKNCTWPERCALSTLSSTIDIQVHAPIYHLPY